MWNPFRKANNMNIFIENIMSHAVQCILNEISKHCDFVNNLQQKGDLTPDKLNEYNQKFMSLINTLRPVLDYIKTKHPEIVPIIDLAESYAKITQNN